MRRTILCLALVGAGLAIPNGYYHQEYNYKTSASEFKNNELQHKSEDQGYYSKDGDLEGRIKPKVNSNSEHSEYVNPHLNNNNYRYGGGYEATDLTSNGHMMAQDSYGSLGSNQLTESMASSDHLIGGYSSSGSGAYGSSQSYRGSSNLRSVLAQLQQSMEQDLLQSINQNNYYTQSRTNMEQMERELRRNMTERINNELIARYGQQSIRGGQSYSIANGRLQDVPNYTSQELVNIRTEMENSLLDKLRREYNQGYSSNSRYNTFSTSANRYSHTSTTYRPIYPTLYPTTTPRPIYPAVYTHPTTTARYHGNYYDSNRYTSHSNIRYTPISNPESITTIASRIQSKLDSRLNDILDEAQKTYFSSSSAYSLSNIDVVLERLRNELRSNLTYLLDEDIRRNYGNQQLRDGYYYSVGSNGQISNDYNYAVSDLESLRSQIEKNLINKLNRDFETYRSRWSQSQSWSSSSNYGTNYVQPTQRYVYTTPRYPTYNQDTYGGSSSVNNQYQYGYEGSRGSTGHIGGSSMGSIDTGMSSSSTIAELQSKLQNDLSRQLQQALTQREYGYGATSGNHNSQLYNTNLEQLKAEMERNLTRHIQEYSASGSYGAYGDFSEAQMSALRGQLESNLMRQLQQGLQQSFQTHQSYSSSGSSSSSYNRPVRGFPNYQMGQYKSGMETIQGEDCLGDDPNASNTHRTKRSYRSGYSGSYGSRYPSRMDQEQEELGQQVDESDLTQQVEENEFGRLEFGNREPVGQEEDNSDLTQQVDDSGFGKHQVENVHQGPTGQQEDNSDLTQQVDDSGFVKLQVGNLHQVPTGQQEDNSDLTQQVEDSGFGKLQVENVHQGPTGQQEDNSDLTQQVEDSGFGKLQIENVHQGPTRQQEDNSDMTQQVEDSGFGKLQVGNQFQSPGQLELNSDAKQKMENTRLTQHQQEHYYPIRRNQHLSVESQIRQEQQITHHTGFKPANQQALSQITEAQLDVYVNQLEQDLSRELQKIVQNERNSEPDIQQITRVLQSKITIPGSLTDQQIRYVTTKVQTYIVNEIQKLFGDNYKYNIQWNSSSSGVPATQSTQITSVQKTFLFKSFASAKFRDFTNTQIQICQKLEETLLSKMNLALSLIPSGLSIKDLETYETRLLNDLEKRTSELLSEHRSMFVQSQIYRINMQLRRDLQEQLYEELYKHSSISATGIESDVNLSPKQIKKWQDLKTTLSVQLKFALLNIPKGLSNPEAVLYRRKLEEELKENITRLVSEIEKEDHDLFTTLEIHLIQKQLENNLEEQLELEVDGIILPNNNNDSQTSPKPLNVGNQFIEHPEPNPTSPTPKSWKIEGLNEKQVHFCQYLEDTLTKKLNEAIENESTFNDNTLQTQIVYQNLIKEVEKNVTARLEGFSQYFLKSYMAFDADQLELIKNQLLFNLELKLKEKIPIDNHRGDMRPDQVGTKPGSTITSSGQPSDVGQQEEIDIPQEEIGQQQEELGQEEIEDSFEKLQPIKPQFNVNINTNKPVQETEDSFEKLQPIKPQENFNTHTNKPIQNYPNIPQVPINNNGRPQILDFGPDSRQPQIPSGSLQFGEKSTTVKPANSNQFLQTEIDQQQTDMQNQHNARPDSGTSFGVSSQGQIITQEQTRGEAELTADSLLNVLRNKTGSQQNVKPVQEENNYGYRPYGNYDRTPTYGSNPSSHGSNSPSYGSYSPTYGNSAPTYGNIAPSYGNSAPSYNRAPPYASAPSYTNIAPSYGNTAPSYGIRAPSYGSSAPSYGNGAPSDNRYGPYNSNAQSQGSTPSLYGNKPYHYGTQETLDHQFELTSDIEPLVPAKANEVTPVQPSSTRPSYNVHIKGRKPVQQSVPAVFAEPEQTSPETLDTLDETTTVSNEDLPWWKRFSNKVKSGASKLKEKIVG